MCFTRKRDHTHTLHYTTTPLTTFSCQETGNGVFLYPAGFLSFFFIYNLIAQVCLILNFLIKVFYCYKLHFKSFFIVVEVDEVEGGGVMSRPSFFKGVFIILVEEKSIVVEFIRLDWTSKIESLCVYDLPLGQSPGVMRRWHFTPGTIFSKISSQLENCIELSSPLGKTPKFWKSQI